VKKTTVIEFYSCRVNKFYYGFKYQDESKGVCKISYFISPTKLTRRQVRKHKKKANKFFACQGGAA